MKDEVLYSAWENLNRNTKCKGVDSLTVQQVEASGVEEFIRTVKEELKENKYRADEVRRIEIPKKNGGERQLGILADKAGVGDALSGVVEHFGAVIAGAAGGDGDRADQAGEAQEAERRVA